MYHAEEMLLCQRQGLRTDSLMQSVVVGMDSAFATQKHVHSVCNVKLTSCTDFMINSAHQNVKGELVLSVWSPGERLIQLAETKLFEFCGSVLNAMCEGRR